MHYRLNSTGKAQLIHFDEESVRAVTSIGTGVRLRLTAHHDFQANPAFKWDASSGDYLLHLSASQAMQAVEQDRKAQKGFCTDCFDHGRGEPEECVRCRLLCAVKAAGGGDRRLKSAAPLSVAPVRRTGGSTCALLLLILGLWWSLVMWAGAAQENERLRQVVSHVKEVRK